MSNGVKGEMALFGMKVVWSPIWGFMNRGWGTRRTDLPFWNDHPAYDVTVTIVLWQLYDDVRRVWNLEHVSRH